MTMFQSAPHFSSEANWASCRSPDSDGRFNPRLTSAARRTEFVMLDHHEVRVSIRASLQQRGEHDLNFEIFEESQVSIRASLQQRGELGHSHPSSVSTGFQSA